MTESVDTFDYVPQEQKQSPYSVTSLLLTAVSGYMSAIITKTNERSVKVKNVFRNCSSSKMDCSSLK